MKNFLEQNRDVIHEGIGFIESTYMKPCMLTALSDLGWKCVIIPDCEWMQGKTYPTEASSDDKEIHILNSYMKENPDLFSYGDKEGWAYHELAHAVIFAGRLPFKYLAAATSNSEYPFFADEIYCFSLQIKNILKDGRYDNLLRFYREKMPWMKKDIELIRDALFR